MAVPERAPLAQHRISGRDLNFSSSPLRRGMSASGRWRAFGMWPWAYSPWSRTSMTTASSRLIRRVASTGEIDDLSPRLRRVSTSSQLPLTTASAAQYQFCCRNSTKCTLRSGREREKSWSAAARAVAAEHFAHQHDQLQGALVADAVIDAIG